MSARVWGLKVCGRGLLAFPREPESRNRKNRPSLPGSPHSPSLEAAPHPAALTCKGFWGRVELALRQSTREQQRSTGNSSLGGKIPCRRRHGQPLSQTRVSSFRLILALERMTKACNSLPQSREDLLKPSPVRSNPQYSHLSSSASWGRTLKSRNQVSNQARTKETMGSR